MAETTDFDSAFSTGIGQAVGFNRDLTAAIGERSDAAASSPTGLHSATSLLKGVLSEFGLGAGTGVTDTTPRLINNPQAAIGAPTDAAASYSASGSVPALLKGIMAVAGV